MRGDINLLPKRTAKDSTKLASGFILVVIVAIILSGIFLVYFPNKHKLELEKEIADKESELAKYTATQEEYNELASELNLLNERIISFDNIVNSQLLKSKLISDLESSIPNNIVLDSISISDGMLAISGTTTSEEPVLVSQFMVNLRNIEEVTDVTMSSIDNLESGYSFSLTVNYYIDLLDETPEGEISEGDTTEETTEEADWEEGAE